MPHPANIYRLGVKELWSLAHDPVLLGLIAYCFSVSIYVASTAVPDILDKVPIAIVDEDASPLSARLAAAFYRPRFNPPANITQMEMDAGMDAGDYSFVLDIPPDFQRDVLAGRSPVIQLNVDATRMTQAFTGNGYIQEIALGEVSDFVQRYRGSAPPPVDLNLRACYNPNLEQPWFYSLSEILNNVTMLGIILTGAALIREREHGTIEHLLAMPVTPAEIMLSKVWAMGLVVLLAAGMGLLIVVQGLLRVPIAGSVPLFLAGTALHLYAMTALAIFMATLARSMPQFGMLAVLIVLPLLILSGTFSPRESMPELVQNAMLVTPTTHYVAVSQAILFRGAGLSVVWPQFLAMFMIGALLFACSLARFRQTISELA